MDNIEINELIEGSVANGPDKERASRGDAFELDAWLCSEAPEVDALTARVAEIIKRVTPVQRWSVEKTLHLRLVLANLCVAAHRTAGKPIKYYRTPKAYASASRTRPKYLSGKVLPAIIDGLCEAGLAEGHKGRWDVSGHESSMSTFIATQRLLDLFHEFGVERASFKSDRRKPLIEMRSPKDRQGHSQFVEPPPAPSPTAAALYFMGERVRAFNEFIAGHDIGLAPEFRELGRSSVYRDDQGQEREYWIDLYDVKLRRVFNNVVPGEFDLTSGGRFYDGWWQRIKSECRPHITIDGEPTVELDYSGFHPRMIYHQRGIPFVGDPYGFPVLRDAAPDFDPDKIRASAKILMNVLINANQAQLARIVARPSEEVAGEYRVELPDCLSVSDVIAAIRQGHEPIADTFGTGIGLKLQFLDSTFCESILQKSVRQEVPVLPVHDSFICRLGDEATVLDWMNSTYCSKLKFLPTIKRKCLPLKDFDNNHINDNCSMGRDGLNISSNK